MTVTWQFGTIRGDEKSHRTTPCVVKIGGSIFTRPDWPAVTTSLLREIHQPLIVVGGGSVVDGLRAIDAVSPRPNQLVHELAIDAMTITARLVADALGVPLVATTQGTTPAVLDVAAWLTTAAPFPDLPASWDVTSDSLAAAAAIAGHRSLLLAKAAAPPTGATTLESLAAAGWVDAYFPTAATALPTIAWAATHLVTRIHAVTE